MVDSLAHKIGHVIINKNWPLDFFLTSQSSVGFC